MPSLQQLQACKALQPKMYSRIDINFEKVERMVYENQPWSAVDYIKLFHDELGDMEDISLCLPSCNTIHVPVYEVLTQCHFLQGLPQRIWIDEVEYMDSLIEAIAFCINHSILELFISTCSMQDGDLWEEHWEKLNQVNRDMEHNNKSLTLYVRNEDFIEMRPFPYVFPLVKVRSVVANKFDEFFPEGVNPFVDHGFE